MKNKLKAAFYMRVGSIEQLDGQLEDIHIPGKMEENQKDVLIYCRVARNDNDEINCQRKRLMDYAYDKGFYVKGIYQDIGCSLSNNPERLGVLLADIEKNPVDYVLVWNIDRIGRNTFSTLKIVEALKEKNVEVFCASQGQVYQSEILSKIIDGCISSMSEKRKKHHIAKYDVFSGTATVNR